MKVLYIHTIGAFGGASRSLYEALIAMPEGAIEPHFVAPRGTSYRYFKEFGPVLTGWGLSQFDHTRYSRYRGARWIVLLREITFVLPTLLVLLRAKMRWKRFDVIHVNEVTGVLPWLVARSLFKAPVLVHVRSVTTDDVRLRRTRWLHGLLRSKAAAVVAIDETVRASLPADVRVDVVHNAFSPYDSFPADKVLREALARLRPESFKVGFVGNLLRVKGIAELIDAARLLRDRGVDVELIVVGGDTRPSRGAKAWLLRMLGIGQDMGEEVRAAIARFGLTDRVHMTGFSADITTAYKAMDALCFPSHLDAPGAPIFEAAHLKVPSIVAIDDPRPDTLVDGRTGLAVPARDSGALADAIETLAKDCALAARMGAAAYQLAVEQFDAQQNSLMLLDIYKGMLCTARH